MDGLGFLLERQTIVGTAIVGALLAVAGGLRWSRDAVGPGAATGLVRLGYAATGLSIVLMIVAGFVSGR